jgi:hypothetical protein
MDFVKLPVSPILSRNSDALLTLWIWQWNRLIGGSGTPNASKDKDKAPPPTTPEQRLLKFQRVWQTLLVRISSASVDPLYDGRD